MVEVTGLPAYAAQDLDLSEKIADSFFTVKWLLDTLEATDDKFHFLAETSKVSKVTGVDLSQGKGFISKVYKVTIEFENQIEKHVVCLKVPGIESLEDAMRNTEMKVKPGEGISETKAATFHNRECDFYEKFAPHLDIPLPKIYKAVKWIVGEQQGAIVMESFFSQAANMPLAMSCNLQQLYTLAKQMATWHSYILCLPQEEWFGQYPATIFDSLCTDEFFGPCFGMLKDKYPGYFDQAVEELGACGKNLKFMKHVLSEVYLNVGLPPVLAHGDLWTNNILWKKNTDGSFSNELAAVIDWQVIHDGCMTADLARFMAICADAEVRREHEFKILQFYYDEVVKYLAEKGKTAEFTMNQLMKAYKANFIVQAMFSMCIGPFLYPNIFAEQPDYAVKKAELEKIFLRAKFAAEDAMEYLKEVPEEIKKA